MKSTTDLLQQKLKSVEQFEALFKSTTLDEFGMHYAALQSHLDQGGLQPSQAFDEYQFSEDDPRAETLQICIQKLQILEYPQSVSSTDSDSLFTLITAHLERHMRRIANQNKPMDFSSPLSLLSSTLTAVNHGLENVVDGDAIQNQRTLLTAAQELIALQKTALQKTMGKQEKSGKILARAIKKYAQKRSNLTSKCVRYGIPALAFATGASLSTLSALAHFNPKFAMLMSMHVPSVALVTITALSALLAAYGLYQAIRAYYSVKPVARTTSVDTRYSKLLTAAVMISSLATTGFVTLMQFSPKFALFIGLHLSPAGLITLAAMGTALMAYGVYRGYQAYMQANPTPPTTDETPADASCKTQISQYWSYCFKFGDTPAQQRPNARRLDANTPPETSQVSVASC